jgi:hypothetical protein
MIDVLLWVGRLAGVLGVIVCAAAFVARAANVWHLGPFQVSAVLQAGLTFMVLGALSYAAHIAERRHE